CLRQNPKNGIMHVGHNRGVVSMWAPNVKEPVVKMGCQNAQVMALAVSDNYMVTAGAESKWKVWDLRTYKALHSFRTHGHTVTSLDVPLGKRCTKRLGGTNGATRLSTGLYPALP
ncbi:unnamed protein product, partial [Effrenium voratum]